MLKLSKEFILFLQGVYKDKSLILTLTKRDFQTRYLGSFLGLFWAFIHPIILILTLWFVFQVGFKASSSPAKGIPFILWFLCGMIPWFFIAEGLSRGTTAILEHAFLVKNMVFRLSLLPLIRIFSALLINLVLVVLAASIFGIYGIFPDIYSIQIFYYIFSAVFLLAGLTWLTSSLIVFVRDANQFVAVILQVGFWFTPIFWSIELVPQNLRKIIKLNPVYYIIQGFRDSFIHKIWFWEHWRMTIYFWALTLVIFCIGAVVFRRTKPHFVDLI